MICSKIVMVQAVAFIILASALPSYAMMTTTTTAGAPDLTPGVTTDTDGNTVSTAVDTSFADHAACDPNLCAGQTGVACFNTVNKKKCTAADVSAGTTFCGSFVGTSGNTNFVEKKCSTVGIVAESVTTEE